MKHFFESPTSGSLFVSERNNKFYFDFQDIMRGLTLIDEEDTLKRLGDRAVTRLLVSKNNFKLFLRYEWLDEAMRLIRNPKANEFKHWIYSTVLPELERKTTLIPDKVESQISPECTSLVEPPLSNNPIQEFISDQFGKLRIAVLNGEVWFVGKDVAEILGYKESAKAIREHVDEDDKGVSKLDTPGGRHKAVIINESGLYSMILTSKLPTAKQFKRWVTHEVLPSIRKHGGYLAGQENMTPEQMLANSLLYANSIIEEYKRKNEQLQTYIADNASHTALGRMVEASENSITIGQFAKIVFGDDSDVGRNRMFKRLADLKLIFKDGRYWFPYQKHLKDGWFEMTYKSVQNGAEIVPVILIRPKGQVAIGKKLNAA